VSGRDSHASVHLSDFPTAGESSQALERKMALAQQVTSLVLSIRKKVNIPVRQPLQTILFPAVDQEQHDDVIAMKELILNEVNVKELKIADSNDHVLVKRVKPNFRELGKRYGKLMKSLAAALNDLAQEQIAALEQSGKVSFDLEGTTVEILTSDVEIISEDMPGWNVASEGRVTVALDIQISEDLKREGTARELIKRIQNQRKSAGFEITDRIIVVLESNPETDEAVRQFNNYIADQVLAVSLTVGEVAADAVTFDMDGYSLRAEIHKK
jgi:isoleucyl-tRNA synthetase